MTGKYCNFYMLPSNCLYHTNYYSLLMIDRRGHRKLRLTSRKHFKPKPKRNHNKSQEFELGISLSLSAYIDGSVKAVENLQIRLNNCETVPSGIFGQCAVCCMLVKCLCRMEQCIEQWSFKYIQAGVPPTEWTRGSHGSYHTGEFLLGAVLSEITC